MKYTRLLSCLLYFTVPCEAWSLREDLFKRLEVSITEGVLVACAV